MTVNNNIIIDLKTLRKAAFAIGFGLSMGKYSAETVQAILNGVQVGTCKSILRILGHDPENSESE